MHDDHLCAHSPSQVSSTNCRAGHRAETRQTKSDFFGPSISLRFILTLLSVKKNQFFGPVSGGTFLGHKNRQHSRRQIQIDHQKPTRAFWVDHGFEPRRLYHEKTRRVRRKNEICGGRGKKGDILCGSAEERSTGGRYNGGEHRKTQTTTPCNETHGCIPLSLVLLLPSSTWDKARPRSTRLFFVDFGEKVELRPTFLFTRGHMFSTWATCG